MRLLRSHALAIHLTRNDGAQKVHNYLRLLLTIFLLTINLLNVKATIITVKQDGTGNYTSIQTAYNNSTSGDTILVYPGTYYENLDINNSYKDITLCSMYLFEPDESYIHNTVIDGNQTGQCIAIRNTLDSEISVIGFTLEHGSGYTNGAGGGLYIISSDPHLMHCIIQDNMSDGGGGFYCQWSTVYLSDVTIRCNYALKAGGGINCGYGASVIFDPAIRCNVYLNYSGYGSDYFKTNYAPSQYIIVDTFTVLNPDFHFYYSVDEYGLPVDDIELDIHHAKIEPVNADLYVNPALGNNSNNGLSPESPLKTIAFAHKLIEPDSLIPKNIYLSNGIYSFYTNNEKFPINPRSHITLVGTHKDSTIFDLDSLTFILKGYGFTKNFGVRNVCMQEGYGNQYAVSGRRAGMIFRWCNNIRLKNVKIKDCTASTIPGLSFINSSDINLFNTSLLNNKGGVCVSISNTDELPRKFSIKNCNISHNGPDSDPETGMGGAMQIFGDNDTPGCMKGEIVNLVLTNNRKFLESEWGYSGAFSGIGIGQNSEISLVNASINGNVTLNDNAGSAVVIGGNAKLDIYNSIFYGDSIYELALGTSASSPAATVANVSYSNLEGGESNVQNWYNQYTLNWLEGNIDADPLWDTASATPYELPWNSPCIDAGVPMYEDGMEQPYIKIENEKIVLYKHDGDTIHIPSTDLAGNPRIVNGRIDMGAYEFQDTGVRIRELFLQNIQETKIDIWPNPFSYNAFISFSLQEKAHTKVYIYNSTGTLIKKLMDASVSKGSFRLTWEGDNNAGETVKPGSYIVSVYLNGAKAGSRVVVKKK